MSGLFPIVSPQAGRSAALAEATTTAVAALFAHPESRAARDAVAQISLTLSAHVAERRAAFRGLFAEISPASVAGHGARTATLVVGLGVQLGLSAAYLAKLCEGALCHDLGESLIPRDLLNKAGPLGEVEWRLLHQHPRVGVELLSVHGPLPVVTRDAILTHHERVDGSGYPFGLEAHDVPLPGRIVGLADCYEALTRDRPDRPGQRSFEAVEAIATHAAAGFDPELFRELVVLLARTDVEWAA